MIRKTILKIRRQPKYVRNNIAMGLAGSFTAVVFVIWAYHIPSQLDEIDNGKNANENGLMSQFMDNVGKQVSSIKDAIPENLENITEVESSEDSSVRQSDRSHQILEASSTSVSVNQVASGTTAVEDSLDLDIQTDNQRAVRIVTTKATSSPTSLPSQ